MITLGLDTSETIGAEDEEDAYDVEILIAQSILGDGDATSQGGQQDE